jgi:hypothetical protein
MTTETNTDETASFESVSSDLPVIEQPQQPEIEAEEKAEITTDEKETAETGDEESGDDATAELEETEAAEKPQKKNRVQKRIDEVVRERETERRAKEALQRELDELKNPKPESSGPQEEDFDTYDEYLDAVEEFDKQPAKTDKSAEKQKSESAAIAALTPAQETARVVIQEAVSASEDKPSDFEAVAFAEDVPISPSMLEVISECDDPVKVLYHLGKNKDLAATIANSSLAKQAREIAKIDLTATVTKPKPVKVTNAPDPISPVNGADAQQKPVSEMSFSEYETFRNEQERNKKSW